MKVLDMHIHRRPDGEDAHAIIKRMEEAGVYGGTVFSQIAMGKDNQGPKLQEKLDDIVEFCKPYPDRLWPVLAINPFEDGVLDIIPEAKERGIVGFKCVCTDYFVYEDASMKMLEAVAKSGLSIAYHAGIVWDKKVSGQYNRPLNWEHLIEIPGIRFSIAHCAWPWIDECFALYTKFLSKANDPAFNCEMFLDMTPGTPQSWRRELYQKVCNSTFDVFHNMMWGTDCNTGKYATAWAKKWIDIDGGLMTEFGVSEEDQQRVFAGNMQRFWHLTDEEYRFKPVKSDGT